MALPYFYIAKERRKWERGGGEAEDQIECGKQFIAIGNLQLFNIKSIQCI